MTLDPKLLEILACPEDKGPLWYFADEECLYNPRLLRRYPVREGIPVLLMDEAESVGKAEHDRLMEKAQRDHIRPTFEVAEGGALTTPPSSRRPSPSGGQSSGMES